MFRFNTYLTATANKSFLLVMLCVFGFLQVEVAWGQNEPIKCSGNKIANGSFQYPKGQGENNPNSEKWTYEDGTPLKQKGTLLYFDNWCLYKPDRALQIRTIGEEQTLTTTAKEKLCANTPKLLKFSISTHLNFKQGSYFKILVGGMVVFNYDILNSTPQTITGINTTTTADKIYWEVEIQNYLGNNNTIELKFYKPNEVSGNLGYITVDNIELYELAPPQPIPTQTNLKYCSNTTANLKEIEPNPSAGITYEWHTVNTNPTSANLVPDPTSVVAGVYYLYAKTNCGNNCLSKPTKVTVTKIDAPTCDITGDNKVAPNTIVTYTAPAGANYQYTWTATGATIVGGVDNQRTVQVQTGANNTNFTLNLEISNGVCTSTDSEDVQVIDDEAPTFTAPDDLFLCVNSIEKANFDQTTNGDINAPPDYYEFEEGYTSLNITNVTDNCCDMSENNWVKNNPVFEKNTLIWTIMPESKGDVIKGVGQPSETLKKDKKLWLNVSPNNPKSSYTKKIYTITYKLRDCNGNVAEKSTTITIKPRPKITRVEN